MRGQRLHDAPPHVWEAGCPLNIATTHVVPCEAHFVPHATRCRPPRKYCGVVRELIAYRSCGGICQLPAQLDDEHVRHLQDRELLLVWRQRHMPGRYMPELNTHRYTHIRWD